VIARPERAPTTRGRSGAALVCSYISDKTLRRGSSGRPIVTLERRSNEIGSRVCAERTSWRRTAPDRRSGQTHRIHDPLGQPTPTLASSTFF